MKWKTLVISWTTKRLDLKDQPDSSLKGQAQEFGIWFMDFRLLLWTEYDSGLPTGPFTITKTLKKLFDNVP